MMDDGLQLGPAGDPEDPAENKLEKGKEEPAEVSEARKALVEEWVSRVKRAKTHFKKPLKQMEENQYLAKNGADRDWKEGNNYTVAIVNRHINQAVAALYARDPVATAKPRKQLRYQIWDGRGDTAQAAMQLAGQGDPNASAIVQDIIQGRQSEDMETRMGQSAEILWSYFTADQASGFKKQMKALVRRTKVCGVAYVKLGFQRMLEPRPEIAAKLEDATSMLTTTERLLSDATEPDFDINSAQAEELKCLIQTLQDQAYMVVREGPVFDFPRAKSIIVDPACTHLKTFTNARWVAHEFELTRDEILEIYGVDVKLDGNTARATSSDGSTYGSDDPARSAFRSKDKKNEKEKFKVWEVQDKRDSQFLTVCEGHEDFLKEPAEPDVKIERFFTVFPLVFNEIESDEDLYPPSDVELLKDTAMEYNRARQGLREHRRANRPKYMAAAGALSDKDKENLASHPAHAVIELDGLAPGADVAKLVQRFQMVGIDPNQYDVTQLFEDMSRLVGTQQADLGTTTDATATESAIAQQSRSASLADNVDDLDEMLSDLAKATGQLLFLEMSKEMVVQIVGPGAVWPDAPPSRQEIAMNLILDVKAGSSGRPNASSELANLERAAPIYLQIPGANPAPIAKKIAQLLDIDTDDAIAEGLPSVTALNAMMASQKAGPQPGAGGPPQGVAGATNAPQPAGPAGAQPGHPAPVPSGTMANGGNA